MRTVVMLTLTILLHVAAARDDAILSAPPNWDLPPPAHETPKHQPSAHDLPSPPAYGTPSPDTPQPIATTHWHEPTPHEVNHRHNSKPYARVNVNSTHLPANFTHIEELIAQAARAVAGAAAANAIADLLVHSAEDAFTSVQALIDAPPPTEPPH